MRFGRPISHKAGSSLPGRRATRSAQSATA
jgi:hypothetical protein